jgi:UDP-N-acetylglucosamine 2-epimerase (non-hydrolysing)
MHEMDADMTAPLDAVVQRDREPNLGSSGARNGIRWRSPALRMLLVFGTRPELIKFLPIFREAERRPRIALSAVMTSQHTDLVRPLVDLWRLPVDHDLDVMTAGQSLNDVAARVIGRLDPVLEEVAPDLVMVQGDTTSALCAAMAAWHRRIPVAHLEAGLRTPRIDTPFPEEANRRLVSRLATLHFAPTQRNVDALLAEGVPEGAVFRTGNTVVDAVKLVRGSQPATPAVAALLRRLSGRRILLVTTHRRESFGQVLRDRLRVLRRFVEARPDIELVFPVHPNPQVREVAAAELGGSQRVHLLPPLDYPDFLHLLSSAWAIVSDSGGVQEEAPSFGKPLLILRPDTERPEAVESGVARLVGQSIERFETELAELDRPGSWAEGVGAVPNPFGEGDSARRIFDAILEWRAQRDALEPAERLS